MWDTDNVTVTADDITNTIAEWSQNDDNIVRDITSVQSLDGKTVFEFDNPTGRPADVVVYVNGR